MSQSQIEATTVKVMLFLSATVVRHCIWGFLFFIFADASSFGEESNEPKEMILLIHFLSFSTFKQTRCASVMLQGVNLAPLARPLSQRPSGVDQTMSQTFLCQVLKSHDARTLGSQDLFFFFFFFNKLRVTKW